jgi:hypothetical protein
MIFRGYACFQSAINTIQILRQTSGRTIHIHQGIPQHTEVPPNIEVNRVILYIPTGLSY